ASLLGGGGALPGGVGALGNVGGMPVAMGGMGGVAAAAAAAAGPDAAARVAGENAVQEGQRGLRDSTNDNWLAMKLGALLWLLTDRRDMRRTVGMWVAAIMIFGKVSHSSFFSRLRTLRI